MHKFTLTVLIFILSFKLFAQSKTISGYVRDAANGESLIGATVFDNHQKKATVSNNFGFYSITSRYDSASITFSFVGYEPQTLKFLTKRDTSIVILLRSSNVLNEVIVNGQYEKIHETSRTGTINIPVSQIKAVPTFAGEQDVLKVLQLLPGVSGGNEGSSNILIRGGTPDQTLILMDGVPIYNPTHLYGLFSSFNPDAVNNVEIVKSGFPARYGGRLSGIADITLREGNANKFGVQATAGLLASRILIEGPIIKGRTSFLVSGRTSYLTLMRPFLENKVGNASLDGFKFYDVNAKINHKINSKNRLYASVYNGRDEMTTKFTTISTDSISPTNVTRNTDNYRDAMRWKNLLASVRWNHEISSTLFFNITAYKSDYELNIENDFNRTRVLKPSTELPDLYLKYKWVSKINDTGIKVDFDHIPGTKHYLRYGVAYINHKFNPGVAAKQGDSVLTAVPVDASATTSELNAYIEDDINITSKLKANAGLHAVMYTVTGKTYQGLQPRLSLRYSLRNNLSLKASYTYMQQFMQTISNGGPGMPVELWVPVTDKIKPQTSQQVSIGAAQTLENDVEISVEAFYKTMNNLLEYKEGTTYLDNDLAWYDRVEQGRGKSYGFEAFIQKKLGRLTGFSGYTLSWNKRQFDNLNNGQWYYARFDHRHDFKATANYRLNNKHFDISATFLFATGSAITMPVGRYFANYPNSSMTLNGVPVRTGPVFFVNEYNGRGNYRMQSYHRLDINLNYTLTKGRFEHKASIGFYNVYSRLNPFYIQYDYNKNKYVSVSLFPIMPAANYSIKF